MWQLVNDFRNFIITGKCGELRDYKEIWAYSYEGCMKIREKEEISFIESVDYAYSFDEWAKQFRIRKNDITQCNGSNVGVWNFPFIRSYVRGTKRHFLRRKRHD